MRVISLLLVLILFPTLSECGENPNIALALSVVPGIAIHGISHFYIGDYAVGSLLLASEIAGLAILIPASVFHGFSQDRSLDGRLYLGLGLLWGGWAVDVIRPQIILRKKCDIHILPTRKGAQVQFKLRF